MPRGKNSFQYHVAVTKKLHDIFFELPWDEVSQMVTVLQWFFGPEYNWFTAARLNDKAKFDALCKNCKYAKRAASEVASTYSESAQVSAADESQFSCFRRMFRAFPG